MMLTQTLCEKLIPIFAGKEGRMCQVDTHIYIYGRQQLVSHIFTFHIFILSLFFATHSTRKAKV